MVKDVHDWVSVKRLRKQGNSISEIARNLKMSRNTVKRLLKKDIPPKYTRENYATKIDGYIEQIQIWYFEKNFIGTRIFEELQKIGYVGSINPLYRYLRKLKGSRIKISPKATTRFETPYGEQAQFDWSPYTMVINNELKKVICFTMILSASRQKAIVFSLSENADAIYEAIQELFEDFGGVTQELIIDNPKSLVIEHLPGKEPKFNINALSLATSMGFEFNPCVPGRAQTKGKIEKPYQYIEEHFVKGNSFSSMSELNIEGKKFINKWCEKVHGTTKKTPASEFLKEQETLLPLPQKRYMKSSLKERIVSPDSYITIDKKKYSVHVKYVDKILLYRIVYGFKIEVYDLKMNLIKCFEVDTSENPVVLLESDYELISNKVPKSIPEIKRQLKQTFTNGEQYLELAEKAISQPSYHARQILKLKELYTVDSLN